MTVAEDVAADVAVVDHQLGGRNGLWVTCKAKELDRPPGVVIFSAFANTHLAANCAVAGADALLSKGSLGDDPVQHDPRGRAWSQADPARLARDGRVAAGPAPPATTSA